MFVFASLSITLYVLNYCATKDAVALKL